MNRRAFVTGLGAVLAAPLAAEAQPVGRMYRIGMLETVAPALNATNLDAFRQALGDLGYVERQNIVIEYRSADGLSERFDRLAAELVRVPVDVIVTRGTPAALAAKKATTTIPVVMASSGDPVGAGVVRSLARPGGNVTGLSALATEIQEKQLDLLRNLVPGIARVAFLFNMGNPVMTPQWKEAKDAARSLSIQPVLLDVRKREGLPRIFASGMESRVQGLVVGLDALTVAKARAIVELAASQRLPTIYPAREFIEVGGTMAYGASYADSYRRAAGFVEKILKGAKPADLPIEQPTKFELLINLKTAKALGVTIPRSLLLRADQVIE